MPANTLDHTPVSAVLITKLILPETDFLRLDGIVINTDCVTITVTSCQTQVLCPSCRETASREHSRYTRSPSDLPIAGRRIRLRLSVRRFFCDNQACQRRTFVERLPGVVRTYARRTERLAETQRQIGIALGGEAGARSAAQHGMPVSPDTLLRLVACHEIATATTPTVLGVDDWAWKKGRTYGTILVDLERRCVVDLLSDRSADTLAAWLEAHPGVKIISRDRGGSYAEGARRGAPDAIQVADRFHLLTNLRDALERLLNRNHTVLPSLQRTADKSQTTIQLETSADTTVAATETIRASVSSDQPDETGEIAQATSPIPSLADSASHALEVRPTKDQQLRQQRRARRLQRHEEVMRLHDEGVSVRQIAQQMGMGRQTVRRHLNHGAFPEIAQRRKMHSILDRWEAYLLERWQSGCHNGLQLYREIREQGYTGSRSLVSRWAAQHREKHDAGFPAGTKTPANGSAHTKQASKRRLSPSEAAWLLFQQPADLTEEEHQALDVMQKAAAEISTAYTLAQDFVRMVRERTADALTDWIERATTSCVAEMTSFAKGLQRDLAAVTAGLSLSWSNGQVEGQVNRLKLIKRSMYGRASFDLLRHRVLVPT